MEITLILYVSLITIVVLCLYFFFNWHSTARENTRLTEENDKLKATLVKKDFEIAKLEQYNHELKKIVEFYDK